MNTSKKAKIERVHIEEAERLRALFNARPSPKLSQAKFGERFNIGSQAVVWQYLHARIPLNLEQAVRFAKGLDCPVAKFSPRLAAERDALRDEHHSPPENDSHLSLLADTRKSSEARESKNDKAIRWPLSRADWDRFAALSPDGKVWALARFSSGIEEAEDRYPAAGQANSA